MRDIITHGWFEKFKKRHPELVLKTAESLSKARLTATKRSVLDKYYDTLFALLEENDIMNEPSRIFNFDETPIPLEFKPPKIIARKGQRHVFSVTCGDKTQISVLACVCASGFALPPHILFKKSFGWNERLVEGQVPDTRYTVTDSGWSTSAVFEGWFFELFLAYAPAKRPLLLIMDGHSTHYNPAVIKTAAQEGIILFLLPPSTTHLTQPLDRSVFHALKAHWTTACHNFSTRTGGKFVTKTNFNFVFAEAWKSAMNVGNISSSFKMTGIYPFNRQAIALAEDSVEQCAEAAKNPAIRFLPILTPIPEHRRRSASPLRLSIQDFSSPDESSSVSILEEPRFTMSEEKRFQRRLEEGYNLSDPRYSEWIRLNHPSKSITASALPLSIVGKPIKVKFIAPQKQRLEARTKLTNLYATSSHMDLTF